uniref:Uncharacterized protein n=1 Tax=Cannabis sativa TaxID=3483 RepID=A0A803Q6V3_CANSA
MEGQRRGSVGIQSLHGLFCVGHHPIPGRWLIGMPRNSHSRSGNGNAKGARTWMAHKNGISYVWPDNICQIGWQVTSPPLPEFANEMPVAFTCNLIGIKVVLHFGFWGRCSLTAHFPVLKTRIRKFVTRGGRTSTKTRLILIQKLEKILVDMVFSSPKLTRVHLQRKDTR